MKKYFIFIFAFSFLFLSYLPNFYEISVKNILPADRTMIVGEHIYTYDYNVYLSKIRQGQEGRITVVDKYDNHTKQNGVFLQMFYLLSGKITKVFSLTPTATYHLMRLITSMTWIVLIIGLNIYFLKNLSLVNLGVALSLLTASFPVFYQFQGQWWVKSYMDWWQELDILKRISFIPHDTMNYVFISLFTILMTLVDKHKKYFFILCGLLFISVFIQPTSAILFVISWGLYHLIKLIWDRSFNLKCLLPIIMNTSVILLVVFIPLLYIRYVTSVYPWKTLTDFDVNNRLSLDIKEYLLALGPIFVTGIFGAALVLIKKKQELLSLVTWILGAALAITLFKFFPYQSELRFVQTANHIPLAILTTYLFGFLVKKYRKTISIYILYILVASIIILGVVQTYYSLKSQMQFIDQRAIASLPAVPYPPQVMYPLNDFYNGLKWLEIHTDHSTVVLSKVTAGNYIPAYSGNFVYLGHGGETPMYDEKTVQANNFFSGSLTEDQALKFLKNENITYVFYGPQEKEDSQNDIGRYPFLLPVYKSPLVTIFTVKIKK